jgi:hypothetical protein
VELEEDSVVKEYLTTASDGKRYKVQEAFPVKIWKTK